METTSPSVAMDIDTIRSQIRVLREVRGSSKDVDELSPSESEQLLRDCVLQLQSEVDNLLSEFSDVGSLPVEDFDALLGHLKEELDIVEVENSKLSDKIEDLARTYVEDCGQLESQLEELSCSVDSIALNGIEKVNVDRLVNSSSHEGVMFSNSDENCKFKILELSSRIEEKKLNLETLQYLDSILKRFQAIEQFEDALTGLKVIEYEQNRTRLSLRTCIPVSESFVSQHKLGESFKPLEQNHELLIEFVEGTLEPKNVEVFPNDVYIGDIIEAAKALWQLFSSTLMLESRSSLEWLVRRVQDKIVLSALRQLLVKSANKSRHSFEYLDRDEIVIAHMVGGVKAYVKMPLGWPVSNYPLKLISMKSNGPSSKEISLGFLCKVEEMANSLDSHIRYNMTTFMDAIEEILMQQMRVELQP